MRSHARLLATVASLALVTHRAVQARNGGHQCGLSVLQSHLADVQGECWGAAQRHAGGEWLRWQ
eukprot:COSAG04_NODE_14272_length_574_cov_4.911579_1_plen_64_part_00